MKDMDYVQEELARQRRVLTVLMMGGQTESGEKDESSEDLIRREERSAEERTEMTRFLPEETGNNRQLTRMTEEQNAVQETIRRTREQRDEKRRGNGIAEPLEMNTEKERSLRSDVVRERTVTEILWVDDGGTSGVGDLSRTFERDARRYDGGFSLY